MRALGVDPGLASTGWAVVERAPHRIYRLVACGTVHTKPGTPLVDRLRAIATGVYASRGSIDWDPQLLAIEALEVRRQGGERIDPTGILATAQVQGMLVGTIGTGLPVTFVRASDWRRALGAGKGTSAEVRTAVERIVGPVKGSTHACDAIGVALWCLSAEGA